MNDTPPDLLVPVLGALTPAWRYGALEGETIILVHGFRGDHHGLEGIARELARRMPGVTAIVPDLPGFGIAEAIPRREHSIELYAEWLREFAESVAPDGHVIVGHSFGSIVVAQAHAQGLAPSASILINPITTPALEGPRAIMTKLAIVYYTLASWLPERASIAFLGNPVIVRVMSEVMAKTTDRSLRRWIHAQHDRYFSRFADAQTLLQAFTASVSHTVAESLGALDRPTLLIAGERDDITQLVDQVALHRRIPDSRLAVVPRVGHLIHYEAVETASAAITDFLAIAGERPA